MGIIIVKARKVFWVAHFLPFMGCIFITNHRLWIYRICVLVYTTLVHSHPYKYVCPAKRTLRRAHNIQSMTVCVCVCLCTESIRSIMCEFSFVEQILWGHCRCSKQHHEQREFYNWPNCFLSSSFPSLFFFDYSLPLTTNACVLCLFVVWFLYFLWNSLALHARFGLFFRLFRPVGWTKNQKTVLAMSIGVVSLCLCVCTWMQCPEQQTERSAHQNKAKKVELNNCLGVCERSLCVNVYDSATHQ